MNDKPVILIIDDDMANQELIEAVLSERYQLLAAYSGSEGIRLCQQHKVNLVLLDVDMPRMGGYQVCQALRSQPEFEYLPIIFVTSNQFGADIERGFDVGASDYIAKPYYLAELTSRIKKALTVAQTIGDLQRALLN